MEADKSSTPPILWRRRREQDGGYYQAGWTALGSSWKGLADCRWSALQVHGRVSKDSGVLAAVAAKAIAGGYGRELGCGCG